MHSCLPYGDFNPDHPVNAEIIRRYESGESSDMIAPDFGAHGSTIRGRLRRWGKTRNRSDAKRLHMQRIGPDGRQAITASAHDAVRGMTRTDADLSARAMSKENTGQLTVDEARLFGYLHQFGDITPQKAVGPYNVDLAVDGAVAVELFGGRWHYSGYHGAKFGERVGYLFDHGWALYIVWNTHPKTLSAEIADDFGAWFDRLRGLESVAGEYRVVWGDGDLCTAGRHDLHQLTIERARPRRSHLR